MGKNKGGFLRGEGKGGVKERDKTKKISVHERRPVATVGVRTPKNQHKQGPPPFHTGQRKESVRPGRG